MSVQTEVDPWLEGNEFGGVDFTRDKIDLIDDNQEMIAPDLNPEVITNVVPEPTPETVAEVVPPPAPVEDEPEVIENSDGSFIQIEKTSKGWKATLDSTSIGGRKEVFYGKTKNEMYQNVAVGKMNATKELNKLNRRIKLGEGFEETPAQTVTQIEKVTGRKLTADEVFEVKTLLESDPDKAFETWFQKRTGHSIDDIGKSVGQSHKGEQASNELYMESVHKQFLAACPEYYPDAQFENYNSLVAYLSKNKLRRKLTSTNQNEILGLLLSQGLYTPSNLEEAFTELSEDGLLLTAPRSPEKNVAPATPAPAAAQAPERIVRTETRPRAGLGIRQTEVSQTRTADPQPPSVEDLNKLSTEEIDKRIAAERRKFLDSRR